MILKKARTDSLEKVKHLNAWGCKLSDLSILSALPQVAVLSLSVNKIRSLAAFANCPSLTELYLRKNEVADLEEIQHLRGLKGLKILWLSDNPCADAGSYRDTVLRTLPQLKKLDNVTVTEKEVAEAAKAGLGIPAAEPAKPKSVPATASTPTPEPAPAPAPVIAAASDPEPEQKGGSPEAPAVFPCVSSPQLAAAATPDVTRSTAVLDAVMSLLSVLGHEELALVRAACDEKIPAY
jgi:hypothetical protein